MVHKVHMVHMVHKVNMARFLGSWGGAEGVFISPNSNLKFDENESTQKLINYDLFRGKVSLYLNMTQTLPPSAPPCSVIVVLCDLEVYYVVKTFTYTKGSNLVTSVMDKN